MSPQLPRQVVLQLATQNVPVVALVRDLQKVRCLPPAASHTLAAVFALKQLSKLGGELHGAGPGAHEQDG